MELVAGCHTLDSSNQSGNIRPSSYIYSVVYRGTQNSYKAAQNDTCTHSGINTDLNYQFK